MTMETNQQTKACPFEIFNHDWYRDIRGRIWVVVGFWYENEEKSIVYLLQMGYKDTVNQPYGVVQAEIQAGRMEIITANN